MDKKRGAGAPRIELSKLALDLMKTLTLFHCTVEEIGAALRAAGHEVSDRTLRRNFGHHIKDWRLAGKSALRQAQWETALSGNATMLIWLGKQELGQKDHERERYRSNARQNDERMRQFCMLFGQRVEF
jgi:hypothetical protein